MIKCFVLKDVGEFIIKKCILMYPNVRVVQVFIVNINMYIKENTVLKNVQKDKEEVKDDELCKNKKR